MLFIVILTQFLYKSVLHIYENRSFALFYAELCPAGIKDIRK